MAATVSIGPSQIITEGNSGTQILTFDIILTGVEDLITAPIVVPYQVGILADTAEIDVDYGHRVSEVTFIATERVKTISFEIFGDRLVEQDEVFTITLGPPINAALGTNTATGTILNDDLPPVVSITTTANASEPSTAGSFTLNRTGDTTVPLTVTLNYTGSTATVNTDYSAAPTQVTFAAGQSQAAVNITPIDDDLFEGIETVQANLVANSTYGLGTISSTTLNILDNETPPTLDLITINQSVLEKNIGDVQNSAIVRVRLSGKSATPVTVNYATGNSTATAGSDYIATTGQLTFASGSTTPQTITVPIIPDNDFEPDEIFGLRLSNAFGAILGNDTGLVTIQNDDVLPVVTLEAGVNASEPSTSGSFVLSRTGNLSGGLVVNLSAPNGTATAGVDYQALETTATFVPGSRIAIVTLQPIDDDFYEGTEVVGLTLLPGPGYRLGNLTTFPINLIDNENLPVLTLTPTTQSVLEKNTGDTPNSATFQVQLSGKSATPITVNYATANGTATAGSDYIATTGQLTFASGSNTPQTITVPITPDNDVEPDETFTLQLSNAVGATLGNAAGTATIQNDDTFLPVITLAAGLNASEPSTNGTFILSRTGATSGGLVVNLSAPTGTGTTSVDYQALGTTATFAPGSSTAIVTLQPIDDDLYEGTETVGLSVITGAGYSLGTTTSATINLADNETQPILTFSADAQSAIERNSGDTANAIRIQVQLSGRSATDITVDYSTVDSTATAGSDYTGVAGKLTFLAGSLTPQTVTIPITPDNTVEPDETFTFQLSNPIGTALNTSPLTLTILNDDTTPLLPVVSISPVGNQNLPAEQLPANQTITFTRTGDLTQPLTLRYLLSRLLGGNTQDSNNTVVFAAGQREISIPINVGATALYRQIETDTVRLIADPAYTLGDVAASSISINLANNQNPPSITIDDAEIVEGDTGTSILRFRARLSAASAAAIAVTYQTANGTAIASQDYTTINGTLTFTTGEVEKIIEVPILNDLIVENDEAFSLTLRNPTAGATLARAIAQGTIRNNDVPVASITVTDAQAGEPADGGQFQIAIDKATEIPIEIAYSVAGTATAGTDYQALTGRVIIGPGQTQQNVDLVIQDDTVSEDNENVQLQLTNSPSYIISATGSSASLTITDNDPPPRPQLNVLPSSLFQVQNANGSSLKFRKTGHQALYRNELSLFTVDDNNGTINGIAPGQSGYQQAAVGRAQVVFSALGETSADFQLDGPIDRHMTVGANQRFGLMLAVQGSVDAIRQGVGANLLFSYPAANAGGTYARITAQGTGQRIAWEDTKIQGDGDFNDMTLELEIVPAPNIIGNEQQGTHEVVDLRSFTGQKACDIKITSDAMFVNTVGLYTIDDVNGKIDGLNMGDAGYAVAALRRAVVSGKKDDSLSVQVNGGTLLGSFVIANSTIANVLAGTTGTNAVFFSNTVLGNPDQTDHVRLLGDNKFGFEDLWGGGDQDFNDIVLQVSIRP